MASDLIFHIKIKSNKLKNRIEIPNLKKNKNQYNGKIYLGKDKIFPLFKNFKSGHFEFLRHFGKWQNPYR
jgi:hypothetical protein